MMDSYNGKIKCVVLFYTKDDTAPGDLGQVVNGHWAAPLPFLQLCNTFQSNGIPVFFFLQANETLLSCLRSPQYSNIIAYNRHYPTEPGITAPDSWTQDNFEICQLSKAIYFRSGIRRLYELIRDSILKNQYQVREKNDLIPPGNVLTGKTGKTQYLITSIEKGKFFQKDSLTPSQTKKAFILLKPDFTDDLNNLFFHTDMFLAIVGKCDMAGLHDKEIFLLGKAESNDQALADRVNTVLNRIHSQLKRGAAKLGIKNRIIRVPFPVFSQNGEVFGLSLVNCLVENYFKKKQRIIRLFVPNFIEAYTSYYEYLAQNEKSNYGLLKLKLLPDIGAETKLMALPAMMAQVASDDLLNRLRKKMSALGIPKDYVIPIQADFYNMAQNSHAGLHCIVKVVERT